jgi:transcriptional regulator with XRE-family HTH domain
METTHPLKEYRKNHIPNLSQAQLAALLGVTRITIARWETGARNIDQEKLTAVCELTGIAPAQLRPDLAKLMGQ